MKNFYVKLVPTTILDILHFNFPFKSNCWLFNVKCVPKTILCILHFNLPFKSDCWAVGQNKKGYTGDWLPNWLDDRTWKHESYLSHFNYINRNKWSSVKKVFYFNSSLYKLQSLLCKHSLYSLHLETSTINWRSGQTPGFRIQVLW